jgi:hypothetical protein
MCILGSVGVILFVIMVTGNLDGGCLSALIGLFLIGGYIGGNVSIGSEYGAPGVAIVNFVGIILGIIAIINFNKDGGSSYSSSSGPSIGSSMSAYWESRKNDPHTCSNCTKYIGGECRLSDNPKSAEDSCSNWC